MMFEGVSQSVGRIGRFKFQTGPPCGFGWVRLRVRPAGELRIVDLRAAPDEGGLAGRIVVAIEEALEPFRSEGPAWGHPLRVRVELLETRVHSVDSHERDFGKAALVALTDAVRAHPALSSASGERAGTSPPLKPWTMPRWHSVAEDGL